MPRRRASCDGARHEATHDRPDEGLRIQRPPLPSWVRAVARLTEAAMKIVVGLDTLERLDGVADLLGDLRFVQPQVELVHVLERLDEDGVRPPGSGRMDAISTFLRLQEEEADRMLGEGVARLEQRGLRGTPVRLHGFSSNRIVAHADATKADLLALGSSGKGPLASAFLGSVGRKAVIGAGCSVLIAKGQRRRTKGLTVVWATDHSAYAKRCLDVFTAWRPNGIANLVVTTVYPQQLLGAMTSVMPDFKADVEGWVRSELARDNTAAAGKLAGLGAACSTRVETGAVGDTLERVMIEEQADLLVLGAQGHGFLERLTIGSVSLEQALRRSYSVLVVRA
jgi:nucleotide-binding universal stress UspA family protein